MTDLRRFQFAILNIMRDVDKLCRLNNIEYYLLGGSAIGAVRHQGFIPWDDDLDIMMSADNYYKFLKVCCEQLDKEKYYLQVGLEDWPLNFTKVRLRGTHIVEYEGYSSHGEDGIYLDVFKLENSPSGKISQWIQYALAKYFLCYQLSERQYKSGGMKRQMMMMASFPLKWKRFREYVQGYVEHYGNDSEYYGSFYFRTRYKTAFTRKDILGTPRYLPFENLILPVPEKYDEYLTQMFGDYMTPPPPEKRTGLHLVKVDFGEYDVEMDY